MGTRTRLTLLLLLLLATSPVVHGTAIVIFRSPTAIILATDGREIHAAASGQQTRSRRSRCKVTQAGRWFFLVGGFSEGRSGPVNVDVFATVAQALTPTTTMASALAAIRTAYDRTIQDGLTAAHAHPLFTKVFREGSPVLNVLVSGLDQDVLTVGYVGVDLARLDPFTLTWDSGTCPGAICPDGAFFFGSSMDGPLVDLIRHKPRPAWLQRGDAAAAKRLIQLQAAVTPREVGPPIDILELTATGARWVGREKGSTCPALP